MSSPSNLYAEKIFSEHPTALWALDDKADYISIIAEQDRDVSGWTVVGGTAEVVSNIIDEPFPTSYTTKLIGDLTSEPYGEIVAVSDNLVSFADLNTSLATFSIGSYINASSSYLSSIDIGYEYFDTTSGTIVQNLKTFETSVSQNWIFVSETFDIPNENTSGRIVIKIRYIGGASSQDSYEFLVNGISFGQWSEEFNSTSLGVSKISIPSDIAVTVPYGIAASAYGLEENNGYYFIKDEALIAKNSGIPMVYGASNVTILSPNDPNPSLIVPGYGFLNELGKYKEYTFEAWLRINSNTVQQKRIVGPIGSDDGIYINGPFIGLKIGNNYSTHFIGEWTKPMLVHVRVIKNNASMLINGEQVLSLDFITSDLEFPSELNSQGKNQDWLGFYSYEDISPIELDCVAIYPYKVPAIVAKKRWVYGQGVEFPENINTAYSGTSVFIDYPFADYTNNYSYPDIGNWNQGVVDNLSIENNVLSTPDYSLPTVIFDNKTSENFYEDNSAIQDESDLFFSLKPNSSWSSTNGYMLFDNLDLLQQNIKSFYSVFKVKSPVVGNQTLLHVESDNQNNSFSVVLKSDRIDYVLKYNSVEETICSAYGYSIGDIFGVGLDIDTFSNYFGGNVASFFGNRGSLKFLVGGSRDLENTFAGNIYKVGFCTSKNFSEISHLFNQKGVPVQYEDMFDEFTGLPIEVDAGYYSTTLWEYVLDGGNPWSFASDVINGHTASYTLIAKESFGSYGLDIAVSGSWEDYIPLTYFAQYVTDEKGNSYYDLDFLQLNLNYPAPSTFTETEVLSEWSYSELRDEYSHPVQREYTSLDNQLFTGYNDYSDLQNRSSKTYTYDTSNSFVKSYVTFQYIESGSNSPDSYFIYRESPAKNGIVDPGTNWMNTKYEVVDNMIVYPPSTADFNDLSVVVHLDFKINGVLDHKIKLRNLQIASQAFNSSSNPVGTRFGVPIYPYKKSGVYFDYKSRNPFSIYKGSSPYLYLTRYSGIQLRGQYDPLVNRGLSIPINQSLATNYKVMAMQAAIRYDEDFFPYSPTQIFEIQSKDSLIKFYMVANHPSGKRAKIYAVNTNTGQIESGIAFYWNGNLVKEPSITVKEWGFLGISFSNILDFRNVTGAFRINGPILVNNISHYQSTNLQEVQQVALRPWFKVKYSGINVLDWEFWDSAYLWQGVLVLSSTSYYGVNPSDIYKSYTGTNKIIVDDDRVFSLNSYEYNVYQDVSWQQDTINAV